MKKMFNKKTLGLHWFYDNEHEDGYTEKVPLGTGCFFNEENNEWELQPVSVEEQQAAAPDK